MNVMTMREARGLLDAKVISIKEMRAIDFDPPSYETPPFETVNSALAFAFNQAISAKCSLPNADPRPPSKGLSGLDGSLQAGLILAEVDKLAPLHVDVLGARFCHHTLPCSCGQPCCSGYRLNPQWSASVHAIAVRVMTVLSGRVSHYHLRRALVARHFGESVSFTEIASRCRVDRDTASMHNQRVHDFLRIEERKARFEIEARLKKSGVIP